MIWKASLCQGPKGQVDFSQAKGEVKMKKHFSEKHNFFMQIPCSEKDLSPQEDLKEGQSNFSLEISGNSSV